MRPFQVNFLACLLALNSTVASAQVSADPPTHPVIMVKADDFCEDGPWSLVFEEEFNGDSLDSDRWSAFTGVNKKRSPAGECRASISLTCR